MRESTKKLYSLIAVLSLFGGTLYVFVSFVMPSMDERQVLRGEKSGQEQIYTDDQNTANNINQLMQTYASFADAQNNVSNLLPLSDLTPELMNQINGLAKINKVLIDGINFEYRLPEVLPPEAKRPLLAPYATTISTIHFHGAYADIRSFVSMLGNNVRLMDVISLSLSGGGTAKSPVLDGVLVVNSYYQP
jgi:Tfp pilus assembly protein PilO